MAMLSGISSSSAHQTAKSAAMAADFAVWCAVNELIPDSMAMRRADEAEQEAARLGRAVRESLRRDDDAPGEAGGARGLEVPAQARPQAPHVADGQVRLVPEARAVAQEGRIARLTVTLLDTKPTVWRQIEVPAGSTFAQLHTFLNTAMGWEDCHLHSFSFGDRVVGGPELNDGYGPPTTRSPKLKECKWQSSQPMAVLRNVWSCAKVEPAGTSICRHTVGLVSSRVTVRRAMRPSWATSRASGTSRSWPSATCGACGRA